MSPSSRTQRRLLPMQVAVILQGILLWVPIEKLFMTEIGFTPASVGAMAAAYAAVVPLVEIPSGILADRWSRRGVMVIGAFALAASSLVGGVSDNVATYVVGAMILGIYFAMNSGTIDAVVYDTVLEETGSNEDYERHIGRMRLLESMAFVVSALGGGLVAEWTSTRATYFWSIPTTLLAILAFIAFREPQLHRTAEPKSLRQHIVTTLTTMVGSRNILAIGVLAAFGAVVTTGLVEFGPLWLLAIAAPAVVFGPYWAGLMASFGVGGLLAGRVKLDMTGMAALVAAFAVLAGVSFAVSRSLLVVVVAQVLLALIMMVVGIYASRMLHDVVDSDIRAGVASGVGTLSWVVFLPFSLLFGWLARAQGVHTAGWMLVGVTVVVGILLVLVAIRPFAEAGDIRPGTAAPGPATLESPDLECRDPVQQVTDYLEAVLGSEERQRFEEHLVGCGSCTEYLHQIRQTVTALRAL